MERRAAVAVEVERLGLAIHWREPSMQEQTFWFTTGGRVGEAEKEAPVEQVGVKVFDTT